MTPGASTVLDATTALLGRNPITGDEADGVGRLVAAVGLVTPFSGGQIRAAGKAISFAKHYFDQKFLRGVRSADVWDALKHPLKVRDKVDELGRPSQQIVGQKATVVQNPETGQLINTWPTSTRAAERLKRRGDQP